MLWLVFARCRCCVSPHAHVVAFFSDRVDCANLQRRQKDNPLLSFYCALMQISKPFPELDEMPHVFAAAACAARSRAPGGAAVAGSGSLRPRWLQTEIVWNRQSCLTSGLMTSYSVARHSNQNLLLAEAKGFSIVPLLNLAILLFLIIRRRWSWFLIRISYKINVVGYLLVQMIRWKWWPRFGVSRTLSSHRCLFGEPVTQMLLRICFNLKTADTTMSVSADSRVFWSCAGILHALKQRKFRSSFNNAG